ncbi:hypothetical protein AMATHDRAFT_55923 [Amanita thiersii Skay4041]|uniref:Major facilitator superfamily (MFS) profile domain-containing protein n=1 Tax=Amanita thiersii Skay4041 TaxID=703135 RepID=A0A2A9NYQ0_9AGAR|nr:hypothetical protein AMATHDRAFT_55923 [Amanita thiersii Skay4041]
MQPPGTHLSDEEDSLLPGPNVRRTEEEGWTTSLLPLRRFKAHPFWLIPVVLICSMSRGVTMAPRIQVFKAIACRAINNNSPNLLEHTSQDLRVSMDCTGSEVQARAAKIQAAVVTTMSVLSTITTGFWSRLGDVHGRKPILCAFLMGATFMEFVFVLVMRPDSVFSRYAEQLILLGPIVEGLVGGLSTFNGVVHAYTSDCTRHGSRSKIFSTIQGTVFVGLAMGPWLSGLVLPSKDYSDWFFYISMSLMITTLLYIIFLCPESRQITQPDINQRQDSNQHLKSSTFLVLRRQTYRFLSTLLSPIAMFAPRSIPNYPRRKSYSLTFVGLALFIYLISTGVYASKYLYAQHVYSWTTAQLGYYMSLLWVTRAINLLIVLPIIISYLKPKTANTPPGVPPNPEDLAAELQFDKLLAQCSLALDGTADTLVAITRTKTPIPFILLSCVSSFTSGGNPSLHSLGAVCLHACGYSSEVGILFGAMAVLSAIAHVISPYIYALTYATTVAYFPQAIFVLAAALIGSSVMLLTFVRPAVSDIALVHASPIAEEERSTYSPLRDDEIEEQER